MSTASVLNQLIIYLFVGLLVWAAATDFRSFIIPNKISLSVLVLYPAYVLTAPAPLHWDTALIAGAVVFVVGLVMFNFGVMGGGDVKLATGCVIWAGPKLFLPFMLVMLVSSLVVALIFAMRTAMDAARAAAGQGGAAQTLSLGRTVGSAVIGLRHVPLLKMTIPYGVAISAAGVYVGGRLLVG